MRAAIRQPLQDLASLPVAANREQQLPQKAPTLSSELSLSISLAPASQPALLQAEVARQCVASRPDIAHPRNPRPTFLCSSTLLAVPCVLAGGPLTLPSPLYPTSSTQHAKQSKATTPPRGRHELTYS